MLRLRFNRPPKGVIGSDLSMVKCAAGFSLATAVAALACAAYLGTSALVVWCLLSVPVLLFMVILSGFMEAETESESEVDAERAGASCSQPRREKLSRRAAA